MRIIKVEEKVMIKKCLLTKMDKFEKRKNKKWETLI